MTGTISANVREIIDRVYPVGIILDFATEVDPNAVIGCGTVWTRIEDGRALIASSAAHAVGSTCGEETVTLTTTQMPSHTHTGTKMTGTITFRGQDDAGGWNTTTGTGVFSRGTAWSAGYPIGRGEYYNGTLYPTINFSATPSVANTGGGEAHNNMQPSLAVCRWQRTA